MRNNRDVQDALQESFVQIFKSIKQYDSARSAFHTWATRITINCSLKLNQRLYKIDSQPIEEGHGALSHIPCVLSRLNDETLIEFIKQMPEQWFVVFNLNAVDGYSHKEISDILGIHESLSRQRLSRARKWIKERMTEGGELKETKLNPSLKRKL